MVNKEVSLKQITFSASTMIIATSIRTKQLYTYVENQAWIAVGAGIVFCLLMIGIYSGLAVRFPGLSLIEINDAVLGRILGKVFSALYIFNFFTVASFNIEIMGGFVKAYVLQNTPLIIIIISFTILCGLAVRKGPVSLMSYSFFITSISIVILLINTLLLIPNFNIRNLLPVFNLPLGKYALGSHTVALIPLSDTFFLMMFLPYVKKSEQFGSALVKGLLIGGAFLGTLVIRDTAVLGPGLKQYGMPSFMAVRLIDVGDIMTRLDIVFISVIIMLLFYKVALLFYISANGIERLLKTSSYKHLIWILTIFLTLYALTVFPSSGEHIQWLVSGAAAVSHTFYMVLLPMITWIVAVVRGISQKSGEGNAIRT